MAKRKIRLTESQLIDLIKKSMISEQTANSLDDVTLRDVATRVVKLMQGDVTNSDVENIQTILEDEVFNNLSAKTGKCALKQFEKFYTSKSGEMGDTGGMGNLIDDLTEASIETDSVKEELINLIKSQRSGYCKTVETPPPTTQQQTTVQENKFYCTENVSGYRAESTKSGKQFANVPWKGGNLSFWLNGDSIGNTAFPDHNILFEKGGKKWTAKGECREPAPGVPGGLTFGKWEPKNN